MAVDGQKGNHENDEYQRSLRTENHTRNASERSGVESGALSLIAPQCFANWLVYATHHQWLL